MSRSGRQDGSGSAPGPDARAADQLRRRTRLQQFVSTVSRQLAQCHPDCLDGVLDTVLADIGMFAGADRAFVFLFDHDRSTLRLSRAWRSPGVAPIEAFAALRAAEFEAVHERLRRREDVNLADTSSAAATDAELAGRLAANGVASLVAVPVIGAGETLGFLGLSSVTFGGAWPFGDLTPLRTLGDILGTVFAHARTGEALADAQQRVARVVGTLLGYSPDPRQNIERLVRIFGDLIGADRVAYDHLEGERLTTRAVWTRPDAAPPSSLPGPRASLEVIRAARHAPVLLRPPGDGSYETFFGCAVSCGGEPVGALAAWFEDHWSASPEHEALIGALASAIGVEEERGRALRSLSASEEDAKRSLSLLEATLESTADALLVTDAEGRTIRHNAKFVDLWGAGGADPEQPALAAVPGRLVEHDAFLRRVETIYRAPHAESIDVIAFEDGRQLELYSQPQRHEGRPVGRVWSFRDITARTRAEAQLRLLAAAVDQACEAVVVIGPECRVEYANPAFESASGFPRTVLVGRDIRELVEPAPEITGVVDPWAALGRGEVWTGNLVNRRADGSEYDVTAVLSPVRDNDGTIRHYIGVMRDLTLENQLQEQLRQSQKMESLGKLAGGVAHDFNNLLTAIGGYAELLRKSLPAGSNAQGFVREMDDAVRRAAALTRQLLAFGRKQVLKPENLDVNEALDRIQSMLRRLIGADIELVVDAAPDIDLVRVDHGQLGQVIMNLVVNARDAMPHGGRLVISTSNVAVDHVSGERVVMPHGRYARIAVADTGVGMEESTRARIFEPFFTTKAPGKGTGLGLSTVYGIVKQSRGFVFVDSAPGAGSTFEVYFPSIARGAQTGAAVDDGCEPATPDVACAGTGTILLAEDEPQVREIARTVLEDEGYRVLCAADGEEALAVAAGYGETIDLLVTDVVMPRLGGADLSVRLRALRPGIKVLFLSGYEGHTIARRGVLSENTDFLQKPFTLAELRAKVAHTLARSAVNAQG